jgi:uncharacterized membrane protein
MSKSTYLEALEEQLEKLKQLQEKCTDQDKVFDFIKLSNQIVEVSARIDKAKLGQ